MTPIYRDVSYTLDHLVGEIRHGNIALPDIQRPFVWNNRKVRDLFDSLYRGYPVGTLMFWETGADVGARQVGGGDNDKVARLLVIDGQQRLTSLYTVLTGKPVLTKLFNEKQVRIAFCPAQEAFEVTNAAIRKNPEFIPDITSLWRDEYRPTVRSFLARLAEARGNELSVREKDELSDRIDRVRDLQGYRFQVIELDAAAHEEQVADIFVRINSEGVKLKQSDFIFTLMSVHWEKGRQQLELFCRDAVDPRVSGPSPKNAFIDPSPDQLLRSAVGLAFRRGRLRHVYNILGGKDLGRMDSSAKGRAHQIEELSRAQDEVVDLTNWHEFLKCLTHAGFRSRSMIISETALFYTYVLWLIGKRDFGLKFNDLRGVIARWFFMAHTTGRYTSSHETRIEGDLGRISALNDGDGRAFCAELDRIIDSNFTRDYWRTSLPEALNISAARSPVLFAYWASLNLLNADLLFSNLKIRDLSDASTSAQRSLERHHLFPKAYLESIGITDTNQINDIANMAFLDWPENVAIGAANPLEYWGPMTQRLASEQLDRQVYWHALPIGWEQNDYPTFLKRRRNQMARVVRDGFNLLLDDKIAPDEPSSTLADLLAYGESQTIEYKSSARLNLRTGQVDKRMEHAITKTVCGFLNSEGGTLLIGVADDGKVLGLREDMQTLRAKPNRDGYEMFLRQHLSNMLSIETAGIVQIGFDQIEGADVCVVTVSPSGKAVFSKPLSGAQEQTDFWLRDGNATKQLHGQDMLEYMSSHWG